MRLYREDMLYETLSRDQVYITRYQDAGGSINKPRLYQPETCFQMHTCHHSNDYESELDKSQPLEKATE
jgi:hypothetical protein